MPESKDKEGFIYTITGQDIVFDEKRYKALIIHIVTAAYFLLSSAWLFLNLKQPLIDWIDAPFVMTLLFINVILFLKKKSVSLYSWILLATGIINVFFSLLFVPNNTLWPLLWALVLVPLSIFLLELKWGSRLSLAVFLFLTLFLLFSGDYRSVHGLDTFFIISFLVTYLFILSITSYFMFFIHGSMDQLQKANKLISRANEAREQFLSDLSHQIRTPLNDIMAFNDMVGTLDIPEKDRDVFEMIKASSQNLVQAVGSFTKLGKLSKDQKQKVSQISFDLIQHLNQLESSVNRQNKDRLNLKINMKGYLPDQVKGDPVIISQIILSLVESIARNTQSAETVQIVFDVSFEESEEKLLYKSEVKSIPLPPFDPGRFKKLIDLAGSGLSAITDPEDLPYLNLILCHDLCAQLNGTLTLESQENRPLIISIILPLERASISAHTPLTLSQEVGTGKKSSLSECSILLVEDNPINQKIVTASLRQHIRNIDLAVNGKEALDLYGKKKYDFILMDIQIPIMDGIKVTRKIREIENSTSTHTPIIAVTANAMPGDRESCLSAGMDEYISKPFMINQLLEKMKSLL